MKNSNTILMTLMKNALNVSRMLRSKHSNTKMRNTRITTNTEWLHKNYLKNLPEAMKGIVKENKDKDTEETFLSINYMKTSLILWKALQESISKISHLEASVYELQEAVKELKGKGKAKAKAKAKSKSKEN